MAEEEDEFGNPVDQEIGGGGDGNSGTGGGEPFQDGGGGDETPDPDGPPSTIVEGGGGGGGGGPISTIVDPIIFVGGGGPSTAIICFAKGTRIAMHNNQQRQVIESLRPGMRIQSSLCPSGAQVKALWSCWTRQVVIFRPFTLGKKQKNVLIASPFHLLFNECTNKWSEAMYAPGGDCVTLDHAIQLFNVQIEQGWGTMIAENVLCETCAVTVRDKHHRARAISNYNIPHCTKSKYGPQNFRKQHPNDVVLLL
jgi:hypothetical protein